MKSEIIPQISDKEYQTIKKAITGPESPFAFDPIDTHIVIIHKLTEIQKRLDKIEESLKD